MNKHYFIWPQNPDAIYIICFIFYILKIRKILTGRLSDLAQVTALGQSWAYRWIRGRRSVTIVQGECICGRREAIPQGLILRTGKSTASLSGSFFKKC